MPERTPPREDPAEPSLPAYLRELGRGPGYLDVRWRAPGGVMRRRFVAAAGTACAAELILRMAARADVYVGVAPRASARHGGRAGIAGAAVLWADLDSPSALARTCLLPAPSLLVASGTPGHHHAYWLLDRHLPPEEIERANRALADLLGADAACADLARVLRPPGTLNHKHSPPRKVRMLELRPHPRHVASEFLARLAQPGVSTAPGAHRRVRRVRPRPSSAAASRRGDPLRAIPAAEYVRALCGREPDAGGMVLCPFHLERTPSLRVYGDGTFYCFGRGCGAGGSVYDFAARLWGIGTRGGDFLELRRRLSALLAPERGAGGTPGAAPARPDDRIP